MLSQAPFVHPTAIVEPGASIGDGTAIWHHSHLRAGSVIGRGCTLGKNVFVDAGVKIGDEVKIQNNVSVYRGVELADGVFVGPSAVFTNDLRPRARSMAWQARPTRIRRGASIGANATVLCGIEIGEHAMVGAGAVVTAPVRPHQLVAGQPRAPPGLGVRMRRDTGPDRGPAWPSFDVHLARMTPSRPRSRRHAAASASRSSRS